LLPPLLPPCFEVLLACAVVVVAGVVQVVALRGVSPALQGL
jgi:hypothetical protein